MDRLISGRERLAQLRISPSEAAAHGIRISADGAKRDGLELLAFADVEFSQVAELRPEVADIAEPIQRQLKNDALYAQYLERHKQDVESLRRDEAHEIPHSFDYEELKGLSHEIRSKLVRVRPRTLGQAGRIEGMTPAALTLILAKLRRDERKRA